MHFMESNLTLKEIIFDKFSKIKLFLNERQIRLFAAVEASSLGYGGISTVAEATGLSRVTITLGCKELSGLSETDSNIEYVRKDGGGRKKTVSQDKTLKSDLEKLIDPFTRGDPESPLKWTSKSVRNLSDELITLIANKGGVIGLNFAQAFLGTSSISRIEDIVKHGLYIRNLGGDDVVALGTDFDGIRPDTEIEDIAHMPELYDAFIKAGLSEDSVDKIFWKNADRLFKEIL